MTERTRYTCLGMIIIIVIAAIFGWAINRQEYMQARLSSCANKGGTYFYKIDKCLELKEIKF